MIHHMGYWVVPPASLSWVLFLVMVSPGACLHHRHLLCRLSRHRRCGVLELLSSRSGSLFFFIAVHFVGDLNVL